MTDERERFRGLVRDQPISRKQAKAFVEAPVPHIGQAPTVVHDGNDLDFGARPTVNVSEVNVGDIDWPADPFGYQHGQQTSALAVHIAKDCFAIANGVELDALRIAAMVHDVCRREPNWRLPDAGHAQRAAEFLERYLQRRNEATSFIDRACRLVALHDLSGDLPRDPLAQALWDADSLESARHAPGSPEGLRHFRHRMKRVVTPYAMRKEVRNVALRQGGWNIAE